MTQKLSRIINLFYPTHHFYCKMKPDYAPSVKYRSNLRFGRSRKFTGYEILLIENVLFTYILC